MKLFSIVSTARQRGEDASAGWKQWFVFQKKPLESWSTWKKVLFWVYTGLLYGAATFGVAVISLAFAASEYGGEMFESYFEFPLLIFLNALPVLLLGALLYFLLGRAWLAFLLQSIVILGGTFVNWFKLSLRNDPLLFADVLLVREAQNMAGQYEIIPTAGMWLSVAGVLAVTVLFFFFLRGKPHPLVRTGGALAVLIIAFLVSGKYADDNLYSYDAATDNSELISPWSDTQVYISRGFVYPFLHSITDAIDRPPEGYDEDTAAALMEDYEDAHIPEDKKVNVISVMLEAYNDFGKFEEVNLAYDAYEEYHKLEEEGISGNLVTNIFAGGTVDTERCFLTGYSQLSNFRTDTNAYPWYFRDEGYTVEGSHPCFEWFYNRENINQYLGFENYYFVENYYEQFTGGEVALDEVLFPEIIQFYEENKETGKPYFSFNVSYQGHGPYDSEQYWWSPKGTFIDNSDGKLTNSQQCILENYLGSIWNTNQNLAAFFDYFREEEEPVVIVLFGDHNPWMGDDGEIYDALDINMDLSTQEGFLNYYSTRYLIWANDAAKEVLDNDFSGEGPDIGPYFLMNLLFEECGWEGPAFMQMTDEVMDSVQVVHSSGRYVKDGQVEEQLELEDRDLVADYRNAQYYWRKHFYKKEED